MVGISCLAIALSLLIIIIKRNAPIPLLFILFIAFLTTGSISRLLNIVVLYIDISNIRHFFHILTSAITTITAVVVFYKIPVILLLKSPDELNQMNKELMQLKNKNETLMTSLSESIITTDVNGTIIDWNGGSEHIFLYSKDEVIGKNITILIPEKYLANHINRITFLKDHQEVDVTKRHLELEAVKKDKIIIPVEISISRWSVDNEIYYTGIIRDISHRKLNERQIEILNMALRDRVKALETFQYLLLHDLNAPIRTITGFSEILHEDYNQVLDNNGKEYVNKIIDAISRLKQLIDDLLKLSRITSYTQLNLIDIIFTYVAESILITLKSKYSHNVEYTIEPNITIKADEKLITLAITNLIDNALKFSSKKEKSIIYIGSLLINDERVYFVRDNGVGFDMTTAKSLFEPFQRFHTNEDFPGSGIGLTITKRIIELHKGRIWIESQPNKGTTVYFTLGT